MTKADQTASIQTIQTVLGVAADGVWGPKSQAALNRLAYGIPQATVTTHHGKASSFADPADVAAFKRCKATGKTDKQCFDVGDNAIGCWGDSTAEGTGPSCAVPPEDMVEKWGTEENAKHKLIDVTANDQTVTCVLKDVMPPKAEITNGAVIDLNPDAVRELGLQPPVMVTASWNWVA